MAQAPNSAQTIISLPTPPTLPFPRRGGRVLPRSQHRARADRQGRDDEREGAAKARCAARRCRNRRWLANLRRGQPIADTREGLDREAVLAGLGQTPQASDAAVDRILADDAAAPAAFDQGGAGDDTMLLPGQRPQDLDHP